MDSKPNVPIGLPQGLLACEKFCDAAWSAFTMDPLLGVQLVREDGLVLYVNDQAADMVFGPGLKAAACIGKNARDFAPSGYVEERLAGLRTISSPDEVHIARSIIEGRQMVSTVRLVPTPKEVSLGQRVYLVLTRHVEGSAREALRFQTDSALFEPKTVRLGPLECLSARELEVLAMIGNGLSTPEIAERLFRSVNTVNDHRKAISRKLGIHRRAHLAEVARRAGLTPEDASRTRT